MKTISVVIPCLNEEQVLPLYYEEMKKVTAALPDLHFELLFIDDGSVDGTLRVMKKLHAQDQDCHYCALTRNFGKEAALFAGMEHSSGEYVIIMDADLQDPPSLIPRMVDEMLNGCYDCIAVRRKDRKGEKWFRSLMSRMFYKALNRMTPILIAEGARDYRIMNRKMVDGYLMLKERNRFSKGLFAWSGFRTKWIMHENVQRAVGDTRWTMLSLTRYALDGILGFSTLPLSISSYSGIFLCAASLLMMCVLIIRYLLWHDPVQGWTTLMCVMLLLGGFQLFCIGILGQYLSRTYIEVKNRPIYMIRETDLDPRWSNESGA